MAFSMSRFLKLGKETGPNSTTITTIFQVVMYKHSNIVFECLISREVGL